MHQSSYCLSLMLPLSPLLTSRQLLLGTTELSAPKVFTMKTMIERTGAGGGKMGGVQYKSPTSGRSFTKFSLPTSTKRAVFKQQHQHHGLLSFQKTPLPLRPKLQSRAMSPTLRSTTKRTREDAELAAAAEEPAAKVQKISKAPGNPLSCPRYLAPFTDEKIRSQRRQCS